MAYVSTVTIKWIELESLISREKTSFFSESPCTDGINTIWIILKWRVEPRSSLHSFIDFENAFDSVNKHYIIIVIIKTTNVTCFMEAQILE